MAAKEAQHGTVIINRKENKIEKMKLTLGYVKP
jgi:hypothetical protein